MSQTDLRTRVAALRLGRLSRLLRLYARLTGLLRGPVTVEAFLRARGLDGGVLRSVWGTFGKRVKALYKRLHRGRGPATVWTTVVSPSGTVREIEIAAYRSADLPLLWAVWSEHYAV
jgi:hypothetical protein